MKSVALHNLGCKVNAYELEVMGQKLQESGYCLVPFDSPADIYIVNTCTVTNIADRKSRQMLHRAKKQNPGAVVVATGCYVQTGGRQVQEDPCVDLIVGNDRKKDIVEILEAYLNERQRSGDRVSGAKGTETYGKMCQTQAAEHTRAYIKIQDGCDQFCSSCIIPFARGRVRSRQPEEVLEEVRELARRGYREVVVTGIHVSSYGADFERQAQSKEEAADGPCTAGRSGTDAAEGLCAVGKESAGAARRADARQRALEAGHLIRLLERIAQTEGIERIRLGSLEPRIVTEDFACRLAAIPKLCPHFHLSLQSGCDDVLRRMNRHYTAGEYYEKVEILRAHFDRPAITTDVIVGFPGETEAEFAQTCAFLEKVRFFEMHIFKYSRRKGTAADRMPGQLTESEKQARSARLIQMEAEHSRQYRASYIGKEVEILVEEEKEIDGRKWWIGHTDTYVVCAVEAEKTGRNRFFCGRAAGFLTEEILRLE